MKQFKVYIFLLFLLNLFVFYSCSDKESDPRIKKIEELSLQGEYESSNALGREVLQKHPNQSSVLATMSDNFRYLDEEDSSLFYLEKAIKLDSSWANLHNNRGMILQNKNMHEEAIKAFNKTLQLDPTNAYAYNNLGYSKLLLGQFKDGMKDVLKSEELDDDNAYVYRNKAIFYEKTGKLASAISSSQPACIERASASHVYTNVLGYL